VDEIGSLQATEWPADTVLALCDGIGSDASFVVICSRVTDVLVW
jgi:hypothetical protein